MSNKWTRVLMCVVIAAVTSVWALAQDDTNSNSKSEVRTITGCLTKASSGNEYLLTGTDGSTWEIHENSSVNLGAHVNQTVEAKGVVSNEKMHNMKEDAKQMGHDTGMKNNTAEHGHLKVTSLHKVSDSCQ
ncbi:MAG TPA: hypothetical protein VGS27_35980 [Candidatus Sulfotelmatobacter sp.]|nr:hypothetical protein [Candidatus Sulfotelmatobacter sp.]